MSTNVFEELLTEDNKILKTLSIGEKDHKKILDIYALRINLYKDFANKQHDPIIKAIIEAKKSVVMSDMGLLAAQYEIQYSIAKIKLRLDCLRTIFLIFKVENLHNYFVILTLSFSCHLSFPEPSTFYLKPSLNLKPKTLNLP